MSTLIRRFSGAKMKLPVFNLIALLIGTVVLSSTGISCTADKPPFYDRDNLAEYYGRCPVCHEWVKGYFANVCFLKDEQGEPYGYAGIVGHCEHCQATLAVNQQHWPQHDGEFRIVKWEQHTW